MPRLKTPKFGAGVSVHVRPHDLLRVRLRGEAGLVLRQGLIPLRRVGVVDAVDLVGADRGSSVAPSSDSVVRFASGLDLSDRVEGVPPRVPFLGGGVRGDDHRDHEQEKEVDKHLHVFSVVSGQW